MTLNALRRLVMGGWLLVIINDSHAFGWQQLWATPDQQAAKLMQQADFAGAKALFDHKAWRAAAAFRAKDYQQAARDFEELHSETGYYNQGNALAYLQQYEQAIKAYDLALAINPNHQDAKHNRELVAALLKQQQENKQQQNNSSTSDNKPQQDSKQDNTSDREQQKPSNSSAKQDKDHSNQQADKPSSDDKQTTNKPDGQQQQKQADMAAQDKIDEKNTSPPKPMTAKEAAKAKEQQQAKEQWLRLIPDDPGGLLREKFLRDYIRRQRGWYQ